MKPLVLLAAAFVMAGGIAHGQTPGDLGDLVGARAAGAETAIRSRGYALVKATKGDDRSYTYWWNANRRRCVAVATMDGRYASITPTPAPDCGRNDARASRDDDRRDRPDIGFRPAGDARRESPSLAGERGPIQVGAYPVELGLVCFGEGQRPGVATTYGWSWNSKRDRYDYGNRTEMTPRQFDASVMIQLWDGGGRISLPKKLIPPINARGADGWWELHDVDVGAEVIHAKYRLNGLNKPSVTIDRRSGRITIVGMNPYQFRGDCDLIDGRDHRRF